MLKTKPNEIEILNHPQAPCEAPETAEALRRSMWQAWLRSLLLFCCASVYVELCLHLCVYRSLDRRAVYLVLFGLLGGTVCALLTTHLPKIARQIVGVLLVAVQVLFAEVQLMYHAIFGNFMPISQVSMGGNVITNFDSQILYSIGNFCFGGNRNPSDKDTVIAQLTVSGTGGDRSWEMSYIPCCVSSVPNRNDYRPTPYPPDTAAYRRCFQKLDGTFRPPVPKPEEETAPLPPEPTLDAEPLSPLPDGGVIGEPPAKPEE